MKISELPSLLFPAGWVIIRHGANHDLYGHPDRPNEPPIPLGRHLARVKKRYRVVNLKKGKA